MHATTPCISRHARTHLHTVPLQLMRKLEREELEERQAGQAVTAVYSACSGAGKLLARFFDDEQVSGQTAGWRKPIVAWQRTWLHLQL